MIPVTKPFFPPKEKIHQIIDSIYEREWLTNNGPLVNQLEAEISAYLNGPEMLFVSNGTVAIQLAIKALGLKGELITTPFSYVATTSSILWENCTPVFVDIDSLSFNIDPDQIESKITKNTTGILATHVFGNPCDISKIEAIAKKHDLKVIYDAAHCFGVKKDGESIFQAGDVSTVSFHATKIFHTVEGGGVFCKNPELLRKIYFLRNFGHNGPERFSEIGINGKNSEIHAGFGVANLTFIDQVIVDRKRVHETYLEFLNPNKLTFQQIEAGVEWNYSYFPVVFENEDVMFKVKHSLEINDINPRRYFYPSLNKIEVLSEGVEISCPNSETIASKILCLPTYFGLERFQIEQICELINQSLDS